MKTNQSIYSALFIGCLLAAAPSCSNEDDNLPKEKTPVGITATLTGEVETKADVAYAPTAGDKNIYVYYKDGANTETDEKGIYNYNGSWKSADQSTKADDCIFWDDLVPVNSKYPFFAVSPIDTDNKTAGVVQANQTIDNDFINSDLLMAYTEVEGASKMKNVSLTFKHMLSKLTIKVKVGAINSFKSSTVTIQNAKKDYTINYTSPTTAVPATVAASGTANTTITPHAESDEKDNNKTVKVYSAILPAQAINNIQTVVTVGSASSTTTYTYTYNGSVTLAQATNTTLTLTINGTKVELENIRVTDWIDKTASGDISIDNP